MGNLNLIAGWTGLLFGVFFGAVMGLRFHREDWLGGYSSWPRRMLRLCHISFFGLGIFNVLFGLTVFSFEIQSETGLASLLLIIAAATMPVICLLSAFWKNFRHIFFIPVLSAALGLILLICQLLS